MLKVSIEACLAASCTPWPPGATLGHPSWGDHIDPEGNHDLGRCSRPKQSLTKGPRLENRL